MPRLDPYTGLKQCTDCKRFKGPEAFHKSAYQGDGLQTYCHVCATERNKAYRADNTEKTREQNRAWRKRNPEAFRLAYVRATRKYKYNLTQTDYDELLASQGGVCAICGQPETAKGRGGDVKVLAVDHDHDSGRVRGLLCFRCNSVLGRAEDSAELLRAAAQYLESVPEPESSTQLAAGTTDV